MENIYQGDEEGCGLACLRMLLIHESKQSNYRYLSLEGSHPPYSLELLRSAAGKEGLEILWKRAESKSALGGNTKWPVLLLTGNEKDSHMIYVERKFGSSLLVYDPSSGKAWRKIQEVEEEWNGVFGEVGSYSRQKCPYHEPKGLVPVPFILACGVELLADIALYSAFYFLKDDGNALYPVILFAVYGFLEIAKRLLSVAAMRGFDKRWLRGIYDPEKERLRKNYEHFYRYKGLLFSSILEFASGLFMAAGLTYLVGFNNLYFFVPVVGIAAFLFGEAILYSSSLLSKRKDLEEREKTLFSSDEVEENKMEKITKINEDAYHLGDYLSYGEIIYFILCLALSMIPSLGQKVWSLNYYLFHLFALFAVGDALKKVTSFFEKSAERKSEFDYFLEFFVKKEKD